jgi:hypothetical protein
MQPAQGSVRGHRYWVKVSRMMPGSPRHLIREFGWSFAEMTTRLQVVGAPI